MSDKAWDDLVSLLEDKYPELKFDRKTEPLQDQPKYNKTTETLEFDKDGKTYRVVRVSTPQIVDKKSHYTHRGTAQRVEYTYNPEETSSKVTFYSQLANGEFVEIDPQAMIN